MRCGFVTCVQLGLSCMEAIYDAGGRIDVAFTLHDHLAPRKSGRVWIGEFCREHSIPLRKIRHINDPDAIDEIRAARLDWLFIIGWSQIAGPEVLAAPRLGVLGIHPTLLPVGRGRAAIPWAILKGVERTGVTLFKLDEGVDTGPIVRQEVLEVGSRENATSLYERVAQAHRTVLQAAWPELTRADSVTLVPQDEARATVWPGRTPDDGRIHQAMTVADADRLVRAVTRPYPGAFFEHDGQRVIVWAGSTSEQPYALRIQLANGDFWATEYEIVT